MDKKLYDLTAPQKSIWITEQYFTNSTLNNICGTVISSELLDFNILKKAIKIVVKNNDTFKLHFVEENGTLKQYIEDYEFNDIELLELESESEISILEQKLISKVFDINKKTFDIKMYKVNNSNVCGCLIIVHHIVFDALSVGILCKNVMNNYNTLINNEQILEENNYKYENYILSEKEYLSSEKYKKDKEYWNQMFNTIPNIATIPSLKNQNSNISCKANRFVHTVNKENFNIIKDFCTNKKVSVFNLFMAILSIYMHKINNLNDFVIGTPILNRSNFIEKNTLGMFINTSPLRININSENTISDLLSSIAENSMGLLRHQKYSYQSILEDIRKSHPSIPSLYNIILSYQITRTNVMDSNINYKTHWGFNGNCADDIDIHITDFNDTGCLEINYDYKVDKYNEDDIIDLNNRLMYIIEQITQDCELKVKDIEIVTPKERDLILNKFNDTAVNYPKSKTIVDLFEEQVNLHPNNIAVVFNEKHLTYKELNEKANSLARFLQSKNIIPGSIIGLRINKSLEMIIGILAIIKARLLLSSNK